MGGGAFDRLNAGCGWTESAQQRKTTTGGLATILAMGLSTMAQPGSRSSLKKPYG
jgi:hypothetical protein